MKVTVLAALLAAGCAVVAGWADPGVQGLGGAVVPGGCAVVLGDNQPTSWDSRHYGFVPRERMIGVVLRHVGG